MHYGIIPLEDRMTLNTVLNNLPKKHLKKSIIDATNLDINIIKSQLATKHSRLKTLCPGPLCTVYTVCNHFFEVSNVHINSIQFISFIVPTFIVKADLGKIA